jgi:peptidoglycan hydrolase-like protein with peptidoglycan-binding domain
MKTKTKNILIASGVILAGILLVRKWLKTQPKLSGSFSETADSISSVISKGTSPIKEALSSVIFPLKKGSIGLQVKYLQNWLNTNGYATVKLVEDGNFGAKTESAVIAMQNNPKTADIIGYKKSEAFTDPMQSGIISKDFYDYFIVRTKQYVKKPVSFGY